MMDTRPHYSGELSKDFWTRVHLLREPQCTQAYMLGVILQDVEGKVLHIIANLERMTARQRAKPTRAKKVKPRSPSAGGKQR